MQVLTPRPAWDDLLAPLPALRRALAPGDSQPVCAPGGSPPHLRSVAVGGETDAVASLEVEEGGGWEAGAEASLEDGRGEGGGPLDAEKMEAWARCEDGEGGGGDGQAR